jgi:hypothetical protein
MAVLDHAKWLLHTKATDVFNVKDFGAKGDGVTDDLAAIHAAVAAAQGGELVPGAGVVGATVYFPPGEYRISDTIIVDRFSGTFQGSGTGNSPTYSAQPGNASVILWNSDDASPMMDIEDSRAMSIFDLRFEGKDGTKPTYGIEFVNRGGTAGTNEMMTVERCYFGRYPQGPQGVNKGDLAAGIGFTGMDANNDQYRIRNNEFHYCTTHGIYIPNSQSVWGSIDDCFFSRAGIGIETNADLSVRGCGWASSGVMDLKVTGTANVQVLYWSSENTAQLAEIDANAKLHIKGGNVQCGMVESGDGVLIDAYPSNRQSLTIEDIVFTGMTVPASATIDFGPLSPSYVGRHFLKVKNCHGIEPAQLNLLGAYWAAVPESFGIIEWESFEGSDKFEFRNIMAFKEGRTVLDLNVWDIVSTQGTVT